MAFSGNVVIDVRRTGADSNGGMFNPANANMASDLAATAATGSSPVVTSASYSFVAGDVGAFLFIKTGTNWLPGLYPIVSVSAGAATLGAAIGGSVVWNNAAGTLMGLSVAAGCGTTASPTGGTWSIDYSQQNSPRLTFTDMVIDAATNTKFTSAGNPVGKNMIGNHINVTGGTGFTVQRVEVVSTATTVATCDKALGTLSSTGGTGSLGGALATPGLAVQLANTVSNNAIVIFLKYSATPYSLSASSAVAGGTLTFSQGGANATWQFLTGYDTTRIPWSSDANRPTIQPAAAVNSIICLTYKAQTIINNLIVANPNGGTSITGMKQTGGASAYAFNCKASDCAVGFIVNDGNTFNPNTGAIACETVNCPTGFDGTTGSGSFVVACTAHGWAAGSGFGFKNINYHYDCIAYSGGNIGFQLNVMAVAINCTADAITGGTAAGFASINGGDIFLNCVATGNGSYGFTASVLGTGIPTQFFNCAAYGNGTAAYNPAQLVPGHFRGLIAPTVAPYAGSGNFAPNATAGGGAVLRGAGYPVTLLPATPNARDVGAAQHADSGGGGGTAYYAY